MEGGEDGDAQPGDHLALVTHRAQEPAQRPQGGTEGAPACPLLHLTEDTLRLCNNSQLQQ